MGVILADGDDQAKIGFDHSLLGGLIVVVDDAPTQLALFSGGEEGYFVDLPEVELQIGLQGGSGHAGPCNREL